MQRQINPTFWRNKRVFLTGHTGFKGGWLAFWLKMMGAHVTGFSLSPESDPALFYLLDLGNLVTSVIGDVRDPDALRDAVMVAQPEIVLHLAAQPIVSMGHRDPLGTFATNVMGVANLLEVCREIGGIHAILVVSSDKCYKNENSGRAFRIDDPLGGHDPYSASKAGTEIVVEAYRSSFFGKLNDPLLASARAGNVIGGGDWSLDRLLPDGARAFWKGEPLPLRNANATRPWQHVVEPLYGYLLLVEAMARDRAFAGPWNFGPSGDNHVSVGTLSELFARAWGGQASVEISTSKQDWTEATVLALDCLETNQKLGWRPVLQINDAVRWTAEWYKAVYSNPNSATTRAITMHQIEEYISLQAA